MLFVVCGVCLRACLGGWACGCFYQVWLEEVYKKYKPNGVPSPALMADVMRWNWVEEVAGTTCCVWESNPFRSSHLSRLHWGPSHIHIVRINHPPRYLWLSKWWFLNSHSFLGIYNLRLCTINYVIILQWLTPNSWPLKSLAYRWFSPHGNLIFQMISFVFSWCLFSDVHLYVPKRLHSQIPSKSLH